MATIATDKERMDENLLKAYVETNLTPTEIKTMQKKLMFIENILDCSDDYSPKPHISEDCPIPEDFWEE